MQTSTISTARSINAGREHVSDTYPFSVQMKGSEWFVHDARTNTYGDVGYHTAAMATPALNRAVAEYNTAHA